MIRNKLRQLASPFARSGLGCLALLAALVSVAAGQAQAGAKVYDLGIGLTVAVPGHWVVTKTTGNNRFSVGSPGEDISVIVTDFGPCPTDAAAADAAVRQSFVDRGMKVESAAAIAIGGQPARRYVLSAVVAGLEAHAEVVTVAVEQELYCVSAVVPASRAAEHRVTIDRVMASIAPRR